MESKENVVPGDKNNRARGENWTQEEKDLFFEIMRESAPIIENKLTDTNTNKRKNLEWTNIKSKLRELTGKSREIAQLKGFWRRAKLSAKKNISQHKRALHATGGGERPPTPPADDLKILELCPIDFIIEDNIYDSDAVHKDDGNQEIIYDLDNEVRVQDAELQGEKVIEEIITVDLNNDDIHIKPCSSTQNTEKNNVKKTLKEKKSSKRSCSSKATIVESNIDLKKRTLAMMEEEHELKIKYRRQQLQHLEMMQKLELELLVIEKQKKLKELDIIDKKLH